MACKKKGERNKGRCLQERKNQQNDWWNNTPKNGLPGYHLNGTLKAGHCGEKGTRSYDLEEAK